MNLKENKIVEKILNILLNILIFIFGIILLASIYTGVQVKIMGNKYTNFFGYSTFEVQTGSMEEAISPGDWIIVKLAKKAKINDIITYQLNDEYVTHRVIEIYNGTYITKGDANNAKDDPVDQSQIVGKVIKILPSFGILRKTLFDPVVLITLIITLFLINIAFNKNSEEKAKQFIKKYIKNKDILIKVEKIINIINKNIRKMFAMLKKIIEKIFDKFSNKKTVSKKEETLKFADYKKEEDENALYKVIEINNKLDEKETVNEQLDESKKIYDDKEEELGKTSLYRVISIEDNDVDNKYKEITKETINELPKEDDLEKTSLYRVISVDKSEVDDTFLEIAQNEMKIKEEKEPKKVSKKKEIKEPKEDKITKVNLDLLKKISKKGKNIIENIMLIKQKELDDLAEELINISDTKLNKATIKKGFIDGYIKTKYYNDNGDIEAKYYTKISISKMERSIKNIGEYLSKTYEGKDDKISEIIDTYTALFIVIANIEHANDSVTDIKAKKEFYEKQIIKFSKEKNDIKVNTLVEKILEIQKDYNDLIEFTLKKLETNLFNLTINNLTSKKNMYGLKLEHNIAFSKVYSDYIIDKTYKEGVVAEDRITILLTLLSIRLIDDMLNSDFNKTYILNIPDSLYEKERKFNKLLKMIDNEYAKEKVVILIEFNDLLRNKKIVKAARKEGYKFALSFIEKTSLRASDKANLYIADYLFLNKKQNNIEDIIAYIPKELEEKVIYEDITDKVGSFWGE